jgi:hypothetical protein
MANKHPETDGALIVEVPESHAGREGLALELKAVADMNIPCA